MDYPLTSDTWGPEELEAIQEVVRSGRFTMGPRVRQFEREFAAKFRSRHAVMVNSGSSANLISIAALSFKKERPLQRGDEVIVPAISWSTTYSPLLQYGLRLRFVDVDPLTLNLDVTQLEKALTPRTRAVAAVSILGNPCELTVLRKFCDRHGLYLFEDNCESMGARLDGKDCGTFGDLGTFSTFYSHHISTMEGGMILTDDDELYQLCLSLRAHGWSRDLPESNLLCQKRADDFFEAYRFILPGYNVRPIEMSAAIGSQQLKKFDAMIEARRRNARVFRDHFRDDARFTLQHEVGESSWFSFTMVIKPESGLQRTRVLQALKAANVEFRIITGGNFLRHEVIRYFDHEVVGGATPHADHAHDQGFFVGNFPFDAEAKIAHLHQTLSRVKA